MEGHAVWKQGRSYRRNKTLCSLDTTREGGSYIRQLFGNELRPRYLNPSQGELTKQGGAGPRAGKAPAGGGQGATAHKVFNVAH